MAQNSRGRRTKLTLELTNRICEGLKIGEPAHLACQRGPISENTFFEWTARGEGRHKNRSKKRIYAEFARRVREAENECRDIYLRTIQDAASKGNWNAAAWWLERRYPKEFGRVTRIEGIEGSIGSVAPPNDLDEKRKKMRAIISGKLAAVGGGGAVSAGGNGASKAKGGNGA